MFPDSCLAVCVHCESTYSLIDFWFDRLGLVGTIKVMFLLICFAKFIECGYVDRKLMLLV